MKTATAALTSGAVAVSLGILGVGAVAVVTAAPAVADTAPAAPTPATVAADGLPTVQHNGVAWAQVIIGNKVYVGGTFTEARPAGAAVGTQGVPRGNILAYDLTTGVLDNAFAPSINGEVTALAASPDGSRLYAGGSFTAINGATVWRVAALNPTTGAIDLNFLPKMSASVRAIVATADTVYMGGLFNAVGSVTRGQLAAVTASNATLLPWNPVAADGRVNAMALAPDGASMVVGGAFTSLNGSTTNPGYGLGRVDTNLGANQPFPINGKIRDAGPGAAITALASDGTVVYGSGYTFQGGGNLEGMFAVNWADNSTKWIEDCHGDTYSMAPIDDVIYAAGHAHYCGNVGGFPQTQPWTFNRGLAFTKAATGVLTTESHGYFDYAGMPAPGLLNWYPILDAGTFTGQDQGPWTIAAQGDYLVMAGEFTIVNNQPQQGMVRYAKSNLAPNKRGPRITGVNFNPTLSTPAAGQIRVRWQANWDQDNENLSYDVRRNGAVIATFNQASTFWKRPGMTFTDTGLVAGQTYGYRIFARDPFGNEARSETVSIAAVGSVDPPGSYAQSVLADQPANFWRLGEASGVTGVDLAGKDDLIVRPGVTFGAPGAINGDPNTAATFNATSDGVASSPTLANRPNVFSLEAWFKTASIKGGEIISYGNSQTTPSADYDRAVYMSNDGKLNFGVRPLGKTRTTISTTASYNNNQWHHVVATLSSGGMQLFVDGVAVASRTDTTTAWPIDAYWRIGGDNLSNWPQAPTTRYFNGQLDDVAIYNAALPLSRIQAHFVASGRSVNAPPSPPVAAFATSVNGLTVSVDGTASYDANGPISSYAWNFGDGSSGSGVTAQHNYAAAGTYSITLTVTDNSNNTNSVTKPVTVTAPPPNKPPTAAFTATPNNLVAAFDASASADPDGTITSYAWNFGDSATGNGATTSHSYAAAGTYAVKLTVTDNAGATGTVTKNVTVTAPAANTVLAADAFGRTTSGGWGSADIGGAWSVSGGSTSNYSVANGTGNVVLTAAGSSRTMLLNSVATMSSDGRIKVAVDKLSAGGSTFISLLGRHAGSNDYRAKAKVTTTGEVWLYLTKVVSNVETTIAATSVAVPGLTAAPNDPLILRLKIDGSPTTTLNAKVWRAAGAEPASWQLTASDNTADLQAAGGTGAVAYLSGGATNPPVTVTFDDLNVTAGSPPPPNAAPTAAFTATPNGLAASFNGTGSSDSDGTIANYAWNFGDNTSGTGSTASHTYAAAGTYQVTLTVTDNGGATGTITKPVTVSAAAPPPAGVLAADAFGRTATNGWGAADTGGSWSIGGGAGTNFSVGNGSGSILTDAGTSRVITLPGVTSTNADVQVKLSADKIGSGSGMYAGVIGRKVGADEYRAKLRVNSNGAAILYLTRVVAGSEVTIQTLTIAGLTVAANDQLQLRMQVSGTNNTTLQARVWRDGAAEPATWQLTATDATASLQAAGSTGLMTYLWTSTPNSPVTFRFDDYRVGTP
ncbi:PKD domain-containing protein [Arthrobacter sp. M4]|uniref:PKD domain-containing protein n=1 Tax=Arthrobacter sp. M4 TaxID=218160 RepID=UPI001CDBC69E|nr:PKD domain-containing protein [Arthrobacter sp. M4]MCA4133607.1 PKD domain-containing protein [Arthrobacter sp. M4]